MNLIMCIPSTYSDVYVPGMARYECWVDRKAAELNDAFRQIIPYMVISDDNGDVLVYERQGAEERLHGMLSIGIGGHIELKDGNFEDAAARELAEETGLLVEHSDRRYVGRIAMTGTAVERVHLGMLFEVHKPRNKKIIPSGELHNPCWMSPESLLDPIVHEKLESWSQHALGILAAF